METDFVLTLWRAKSWEFSAVVLLSTALSPLLSAQFILFLFLNILMQSKPILYLLCLWECMFRLQHFSQAPVNLHCLLGAFAKLRKATISFVICVCLSVHTSVRPYGTTAPPPPGHIFIKFNISIFIQNLPRKFKNNEYFTQIPMHICD